jgi:hypothetical protein
MCDGCMRVVCSRHIPLPQGAVLGVSTFLCVACHIRAFSKPVPYFVSFFFFPFLFFRVPSIFICRFFFLFFFSRVFTGAMRPYWPIRQTPGNPSFLKHPF